MKHLTVPIMRKLIKLGRLIVLGGLPWVRALRFGVGAAVEHVTVLSQFGDIRTVVDIGANRGQFALAARRCFPEARIVSFEPLPGPAGVFERVFSGDMEVTLHRAAIGPEPDEAVIHVSARDDSSSLLPISAVQDRLFPGTREVGTQMVRVGRLADFITGDDIVPLALLKLDVQGFELEALRGCEDLLKCFMYVYAECSFVELYVGQALAHEVIAWLSDRGFRLCGIYNLCYDSGGRCVQGDCLFKRA